MKRKTLVLVLSILYIPPLGILDIVTGSDLSLLVLYIVPIAACAWYAGPREAIGIAALALATWIFAQIGFPVHQDLSPGALLAWGSLEKAIVFAALIALVAKIRRQLDEERSRALTDMVTGLPNRRAFNQALARVQGEGAGFSLAFLELEGLEDLYLDNGEAYVESLLRAMASVCRRSVPGYRYSDGRFASILPGLDGPAAARRMNALVDALAKEVFERKRINLTFKAGIAYCPDSAKAAVPKLIRFLEGAMINLHAREGDRVESFDFS